MRIDPKIFRAYDIRGIYPDQINENIAHLIGEAFCYLVKEKYQIENPKILINFDVRVSSIPLFDSLKKGLLNQGAIVLDGGFSTTPLHYFGNWKLKVDGSVMVTASHNPKEYNGFKLFFREVEALSTNQGTQIIYEIITKKKYKNSSKSGKLEKVSIFDDYLVFLEKNTEIKNFSNLKMAVDFANGCTGPFFRKLANTFKLNYIGIFEEPDGNFPNHEPNPLKTENLGALQEKIRSQNLDLGIAFDGDGDRIIFFDEKGNPQRADFILAILAKHYLKRKFPESKIRVVLDARTSRGVRDVLKEEKIELIKSRVGYPFIKFLMRKNKALLGAELSGHFFWKENCYSESPLLTLFRVLEILAIEKRPLSQLVAPVNKYFSSKEINFEVEDKIGKIKELEKIYSDGQISKIDGLTVEYQDWWFNIRPSNTEQVLRLTVEANSKELLAEKIKELTEAINRVKS
jgi:phosphomannomutase